MVGDHKRIISKALLDVMVGRATHRQRANYSFVRTAIKLVNNSDTRVANTLRQALYINDHIPRRGKFIRNSKLESKIYPTDLVFSTILSSTG